MIVEVPEDHERYKNGWLINGFFVAPNRETDMRFKLSYSFERHGRMATGVQKSVRCTRS